MTVEDPAPIGHTPPATAGETARLQQALALLQQHAAQLGDDIVERAAQPLRQRLQALADDAAPALPRLRQVSVLFVDIVESTHLLQALDAEDAHAVLDGALRRFGDAVQRHGGQVLRFMGDGLKAAFGLPEPADDDALRAVRAAQAVLAEAQAHADAMRARLGPLRLAVRAGLHTGPVALGAGAEAARTLVGATVHLAARLEQSATPGTLRVSHDTWRSTRGAFDFEVQPPLRVKGVADPVLTYRLLGERAPGQRRSGRGIDGLETGLIGREAPLAALLALARGLAPGTGGLTFTVLGEAGVGKSRLRQSLLQQLADPMVPSTLQVLPAQAWPETERTPWGLLRDLLLRHADLTGRESPAQAAALLKPLLMATLAAGTPSSQASGTGATATDPLAVARANALVYAIGLLDADEARATGLDRHPGALRQAVQQASVAWLRGLLARGPVLLLADDLHWADDASLDLLLQWRQELADQPLGLVALARPALRQRRPGWPLQGPQVQMAELGPLDDDAAQTLVDALLARLQPVPPALRRALLERAGGNPYFIEELVCRLIDDGVLDTDGPVWRLRGDAAELLRLPSTLAGLLQARVGQLAPAERLALQQAAVVGPNVDDQALAAIDPAAVQAMAGLQALGLVLPEPGGAWRFHHQLLQQAAYDSVLRRDREAWHGRVAGHLATRDDSAAQWVAHHYERAGDSTTAAVYYRRAALGPPGRMPRTELRHAAQRALALQPDADAADRWPLQLQLATLCFLLADYDGLREAVPPLQALAEALQDDGLRAEAERLAAAADRQDDDPERMAAVIELAERDHARRPGELLPRMLGHRAWALLSRGRAAEARLLAERAIALGAQAGVPTVREALESAAIAAWKLGDLSAGLSGILSFSRLAQARGDTVAEIASSINLAGMARTLGDIETWRSALDVAMPLIERTGLMLSGLPLLRVRRAQLMAHEGDTGAALAELRRSLAQLPADDRWFRITTLLAMGHVHLARAMQRQEAAGGTGAAGNPVVDSGLAAMLADAHAAFDAALAGAGDAGMRAEAREGLVRVALASGDTAAAADHAKALLEAMADPQPGDATERPAQWLAVADARRAAGDGPGADQALGTAWRELREQAARIGDATARARFLADVSHNRRIQAAAEALPPDAGAGTSTW